METASANKASSSSSSSISTQFKYEVFLSFSGVDTRNNFTSHLLAALEQRGIHTFIDDTKLNRGEYIGDQLLKAIAESRISLVVLSKNYAASRWCLDELVKIMECRMTLQQIVLPIFYDVEPSDVRMQKGSLAEAFAKHEERLKESSDGRVKKWREALTDVANLSGWDVPNVANGNEAQIIQKVVEAVQNELGPGHLHVAYHEVGLESRLQKLKKLLEIESDDVRIVAVWGMGGIGKTTLVRKLYNLIQHKFEASCFLPNIRETSKQLNGVVVLQERLLSDILRTGTHNLSYDHHRGIEVIKQRAFCRKVLLILDDVDEVKQLKALAIVRGSFRPGSKIIITTRDILSLNSLKLDVIYEAEELSEDESLKLFRRHCFKEEHPTREHLNLSCQVVGYARGLPLALEILGSLFRRKSIPEWEDEIAKLRKIPHNEIQEVLKISFDSLESREVQELFLDMACLFIETDRDFTVKVLDGRNLFAKIGIQILVGRCLIKYDSCNKLVMHDLVRDMGREIVRQESREDPGKRSRLWDLEDVLEVLRDGMGTESVKGLRLNITYVQGNVQVNSKAFEKMNNLWLLHLDYVHQIADFEQHASRRLLWLSWKGFPLECLPRNLSMEKLIALDLRYSSLKKVWHGNKILDQLKFLYLSHCHCLTRTPDFSGLNSLEELLLDDCKNLVEVDESIRCLNKLLVLDMKNCTNLQKLPSGIWMLKSLECLDLSGCSKLGNLAVCKGPLNKLWSLVFSSRTLPPKGVNSIGFSLASVQASSCLTDLNLENCSLSYLPDEIGNLISLRTLNLSGNNLSTVPDRICNLTCLVDLELRSNKSLLTLPDSICSLTRLQSLYLEGCNLSHLPSDIGNLVSLYELKLEGNNNICTLPDSVSNLPKLQYILLDNCAKLQSVPKLQAFEVSACRCASLESIPLGFGPLGQRMNCMGSNKLAENNYANYVLNQLHEGHSIDCLVNILVPTVDDVTTRMQYQGTGSYVSFEVPRLAKQKMLGWVFCAFLTGHGEEYNPGCYIEEVICNKIKRAFWQNCWETESTCRDHVWLVYIPQAYYIMQLKGGDVVEFNIKSFPDSIVRNWGIDIIYEVDENITYEVDENITETNEPLQKKKKTVNQEELIQYSSSPWQDVILQEDVSLANK